MNKVVALAVADFRIMLRRSEALVLNLIIPVVVLVALSHNYKSVNDAIGFSYVQAVLSTSMVSLGIATGFDRRFRVLVRLGTTPLGRKGLIYSKILSLIFIQTIYLSIISIVALIIGWHITWAWLFAVPLCWMSSCAFAGLALLIAGRVKAEANLGLQNILYIAMMSLAALGFMPLNSYPTTIKYIAYFIPSSSLHIQLRYLAGVGHFSLVALVVLIIWSIILPILASRKFSFDE